MREGNPERKTMKIKRLICFVMAFAMMLGTMSVALAAVTSVTYSKTNCPVSFVASETLGRNVPSDFEGINDNFCVVFWVN